MRSKKPCFKLLTLGCKVNQYETEYVRTVFLSNGWIDADAPSVSGLIAGNSIVIHSTEQSLKELVENSSQNSSDSHFVDRNMFNKHFSINNSDINNSDDKNSENKDLMNRDYVVNNPSNKDLAVQLDSQFDDLSIDFLLINTCSVTGESEHKSRKLIRHWAKRCPNAEIVVMGCFASRVPNEVAQLPQVSDVLTDKRKLTDFFLRRGLVNIPTGISTFAERHRAFVKIQDGCRVGCAYCIIPKVRPYLQSRSPVDILEEILRLNQNGYREIVLTGIHLGHYGLDFRLKNDESAIQQYLRGNIADRCSFLPHSNSSSSQNLNTSFDQSCSSDSSSSQNSSSCSDSNSSSGSESSLNSNSDSGSSSDTFFVPESDRLKCFSALLENSHLNKSCSEKQISENIHFNEKSSENLASLLEKIGESSFQGRIRLSSLEAVEVSSALIEVVKKYESVICPHWHLSMQSGDDTVLQRMRRRWSSARFIEKCEEIKEHFRLPALTTDVIVGFPGETERQFLNTCDVVEKIGFSKVHLFRYSRRAGTLADTMSDQIPENVKRERAFHLEQIAEKLRNQYIQSLIGEKLQVLLEDEIVPETPMQTENTLRILTGTADRYVPVRLFLSSDKQTQNSLRAPFHPTAKNKKNSDSFDISEYTSSNHFSSKNSCADIPCLQHFSSPSPASIIVGQLVFMQITAVNKDGELEGILLDIPSADH